MKETFKMHIDWSVNVEGQIVCQTMEFPPDFWPVKVFGGCEDFVYFRKYQTSLAQAVYPIGIWAFTGLDRGDIVETELNVETDNGIPLVQTSYHKEGLTSFDGWQWFYLGWYGRTCALQVLNVIFSCRVTGLNKASELSARFHCGLRVIGSKENRLS